MTISEPSRHGRLAAGLIVLGILARLVPHPWNATPVMAIALFGGTYLSKRWGVLLPLAIVGVSDLLIMWHRTAPFTWAAFAVTGTLGWWLRRHPSPGRILCASLIGSCLFFIISNFGVWASGGLYPPTASGLWECYLAGLPFFRNTVGGDLVYTAALFGAYAALRGGLPIRSPAGPG
ncbi:MAG: hypothetical protein A3B78_00145 [Omnitrophica WOR_2 bacterium RIFCSPHIGHO2_02_FULL_67_20]|nr:MAG: hypothetical protein A3B78_00145 [Omnitrophica WOR_2 bacterium RIFCSPHIGHO2_02_FULL_67_20]